MTRPRILFEGDRSSIGREGSLAGIEAVNEEFVQTEVWHEYESIVMRCVDRVRSGGICLGPVVLDDCRWRAEPAIARNRQHRYGSRTVVRNQQMPGGLVE